MKTDMKKTLKNNGKECAKMEYLKVEIFSHFSKVYTYIVWNGKHLIGEIAEDDMMKLLDKEQVLAFYHHNKNNFKVPVSSIEAFVTKPKTND